MAWIELHDELITHRKTYALMEALKIRRRDAIGMLCMFWTWALNSAQNGDISAFPARAIADATDWTHKPQTLLDALISSGWVDKAPGGKLLIHDWDDYTWRYFDKVEQTKEQTAKRVREYRKRKSLLHSNAPTVTSVTQGRNAVTQCNAPTEPNHTKPLYLSANNGLSVSPVDGARKESPESESPEMTEEVFNALSGFGILYEQTAGNPVPSALAAQLRFRLAEHADPELVKEALRQSIGKRNEGAYLNAIMQSWTAKGITTYKQYLDTVPQSAPSAKKQQPSISDPANYQEQREEDLPEWARKPVN